MNHAKFTKDLNLWLYGIFTIIPEANAMIEVIDAKRTRNLMFSHYFLLIGS